MQQYKPDLEKSLERYRAFWEGEVVDRAVVQVTAPKRPRPEGVRHFRVLDVSAWEMPEAILESVLGGFDRTYFGGDALPTWRPNLGPTTMSAFLGCPIHFTESTSWQDPILDDLDAAQPEWDAENPVWQATLGLTRYMAEHAAGRFVVGFSDYGMGADVLSHLRGPANLCMDLLECPDAVHRWMAWLTPRWKACYNELLAVMQPDQGTQGWLSAWAPGTTYPIQNDFSCMISREMFDEFFLEEVRDLSRFLQYPAYHLDGPNAVQHLDSLLGIPELRLIQWVPGNGQEPPVKWMPLLKRVRAAGKLLHLSGSPDEIVEMVGELGPAGAIYHTWAGSVEEADAIVARVARASCRMPV